MIAGLSLREVGRALLLLLACLASVSLGVRLPGLVPDLAVLVVCAGALLGGPVHGALLGLAAGWLTDLMPPGGAVLGAGALLYAAAGTLAGRGRREGGVPGWWVAVVTAAAAAVVETGRVVLTLLAGGTLDPSVVATRLVLTVLAGAAVVPFLVRAERSLAHGRVS